MEEHYKERMKWWFGEFCAENQVDLYLEIFPELKGRLSKFGIGIFQWNMGGEINIENPDDVSRVRMILKVLESSPAFDFFDQSFNECSPDVVCEILGMSPKTPRNEPRIEHDYTVRPVKTFEEASEYHEAVSWCIVISKEAFNEYTKNGNRFYFLGNGQWWDVPCVPGNNFPHDNYCVSLIAVEVSPDNEIVSVTSRWNECSENSGKFLSESQLKEILGNKYHHLMI